MLLEQIVNGLGQGMIYALMSIGYALIFGVVGLVTFAHGDVIVLGAFTSYYLFTYTGANLLVALAGGFLVSGAMGFVIHRVCYNRFFTSPRQISLVCTIGMGMFLRNLLQVAAGTEAKAIPEQFGMGSITFLGLRITYMQLVILAVVLVLVGALTVFLNKTRLGLSLKAVSMDRTASAMVGINTKRATTLGNMIGCGLAGVAGVLLAVYYGRIPPMVGSNTNRASTLGNMIGCGPAGVAGVLLAVYYGSITPMMGGSIGMKAFCCAVLGGMSNIWGAAVGGLLIGVFENLGIMIFSAGMRDIVSFVCLILVLLVKPEGLFARRSR